MKLFGVKLDNVRALQLFQLIRFGSLLIINVAIVKLGIPSGEIGFYESTLFLANLLTFFWINGCIQALLPMYSKISEAEKKGVLFSAAVVIGIMGLVSGGIGFALEGILRKTETLANFPFFGLALIYTAVSALGQFNEFIYLLQNKPLSMLAYGTISYSLQIACVLTPLLVGWGIEEAIVGLIAVSVIRIVWLVALLTKYSQFKAQMGFVKQWLRQSFPLSLRFLLANSATFVDTLIITAFFSSSVFALYRYGAKDFPLTLLLANGLSTALLPQFGKNVKQALGELRKRSHNLMVWLFPLSILLMFAAKPLYIAVFSQEFGTSSHIFIIYLLLITSRLVFPQTVAIGMGKSTPLLFISSAELLINVSLSLVWLRTWGIEGIAMATVVANICEKAMIGIYLYRTQGIRPGQYMHIRHYALWTLLLAGSYLVSRFIVM